MLKMKKLQLERDLLFEWLAEVSCPPSSILELCPLAKGVPYSIDKCKQCIEDCLEDTIANCEDDA